MKRNIVFILLIMSLFAGSQVNDYSWRHLVNNAPDSFYFTAEAREIAENVLVYQRPSGGWPKNIQMHKPIDEEVRAELAIPNNNDAKYAPTIDNDATITEMRFMAKMYRAVQEERYKKSFEKALSYLFEAQYSNGGFPQFYPLRKGYYGHITYNDDATYNVLKMLKAVYEQSPEYAFAATPEIAARAKKAFEKGIECILKTQIFRNEEPTVWCQQYDEFTLELASARAYELPSFCTKESANLALLLMEIPNPSPEIIRSVDGAVKWFEAHKITGIRQEYKENTEGKKDKFIVEDAGAPAIWARFYDLETEQPFFCDRDGVKQQKLSDIGYERRNGYGWYIDNPNILLEKYPEWRKMQE